MKAPLIGYVRHRDGGLYQVYGEGKSTIDASPVIVYKHIWPFEQGFWSRPSGEWTVDRFTPVTDADAAMIKMGNRELAQAAITEAKRIRKAQEASNV
jgi:hypothetical protein